MKNYKKFIEWLKAQDVMGMSTKDMRDECGLGISEDDVCQYIEMYGKEDSNFEYYFETVSFCHEGFNMCMFDFNANNHQ